MHSSVLPSNASQSSTGYSSIQFATDIPPFQKYVSIIHPKHRNSSILVIVFIYRVAPSDTKVRAKRAILPLGHRPKGHTQLQEVVWQGWVYHLATHPPSYLTSSQSSKTPHQLPPRAPPSCSYPPLHTQTVPEV